MFETALTDVAPRFVEIGVKAFIQGRVSTHNPSFRPKPSELASYVRPMQENENQRRRLESSHRLQLETRGREEPTPEEKARVQSQLDKAKQAIARRVQDDMISQTPTSK